MKRISCIAVLVLICSFSQSNVYGQDGQPDSLRLYSDVAKNIIETALSEGQAYDMLVELARDIGPRLSGSTEAAAAVEWGRQTMLDYDLDNVHLQEIMVPRWVRGPVEQAEVINSPTVGTKSLAVCALGGSVGTSELGVVGQVIEVKNFEEVKALGPKAKGKLIFYNRPMGPRRVNTFAAYGGAVNQRSRGAIEAAKVGAVAALVRSMTTRLDRVPHTGAMHYAKNVAKIPAAAISTVDANFLSDLLKRDESVRVRLRLSCQTLPDVPSANVIGEITGSELPEEIIVLGGHLDSWDKGHGAHDDGAGCVQSIEALRLIKSLGLQPKRSIRAVLFMNEENGQRGGKAYAQYADQNGSKHIAAIESDRGGFTPRGFTVKAENESFANIERLAHLFDPMAASRIIRGYGGVDIDPLNKRFGIPVLGLLVDSHRYFDYHHSANDTIDKVNERELELGAAAIAIMAYVLAMEGV
ncbi:M20/M25/M40 family metallo-hydrolase [candidate division KSB1 bacterium]|nr:M20/M25/M40 family metallo-hydrolase [candidate division KSB1 bacterium]NIR73345.1 M20/M25/M40 family metallo-hydrolase [candidate division KSB1 bacterium]NIS27051.1 M20/M25/M40 family metallo-hydrolase [candidate division KSB1 bacterium]NIT73891.1 M20/M25/M40 family metallo-hydrolase [candidate division KSB1 bacterium]NIU27796.1 M20/M25/M40 family metallo-hydrolase [candidate division KSB1 bacterium]